MSGPSSRPTSTQPDALHTVALAWPGSTGQVLVPRLAGTPQEAVAAAKELVWNFANFAPVKWRVAVVHSQPVTDMPAPTPNTNTTPGDD